MVRNGFIYATAVHGICSQFGDVMAASLNLLNVPVKSFFNESIQTNYGPVDNETFELYFSACSACMFIGLMFGFAIMGYLMDNLGRKQTAVGVRACLGLIGSLCMVLSRITGRFEFYVFGHLLAGIVVALRVVLIIYLAECSPDNKRGLASMIINSGGVLTVLLITPFCLPSLLGCETLWVVVPLICTALATSHLILAAFFPQSPKQLYIQQNNPNAARRSLEFYYGDNSSAIDDAMYEMELERRQEHEDKVSIIGILKDRTHRFSFFLVLVCAFVPVFSAVNIKSQYLLSLLMQYGLSQSEATSAMLVIGATAAPLCFLSPVLIEKFGRRPIFVTVAVLCCIEWLGFAVAQTFVDQGAENLTIAWLFAVIGSILGQAAVNLGLLVLSPIMISEICPQNTRATISEFTQVLPIAFAVAEVLLFPTLNVNFGASFFVILAAVCATLAMVLYVQLMETRGLPIEQIQRKLTETRTRAISTTQSLFNYKDHKQSYGSIDSGLGRTDSAPLLTSYSASDIL